MRKLVLATSNRGKLAELQPLLAAGAVAAPHPEVYPLEQAGAAIASLENRSAKGKVVLKLR